MILDYDSEDPIFFKDHEVILINLYRNSYLSDDRNNNDEYWYLELPDSPGLIIDFKNLIVIDMNTYQTNERASVRKIEMLPP